MKKWRAKFSRRQSLGLGLGAVLSYGVVPGCTARLSSQISDRELTDAEVAELAFEEDRSLIGALPTDASPFIDWQKLPQDRRPAAEWPKSLSLAPDYLHLGELTGGNDPQYGMAFDLSADVLSSLAEASHFRLNSSTDHIVAFGLRGCAISSEEMSAPFAGKHRLVVKEPNYWSPSCVIGAWSIPDRQVAVFSGSTVPNVLRLYRASKGHRGERANMLPAGMYEYVVGPHGKDPEGIKPPRQPGAFRQTRSRLVWRLQTAQNLSMEVGNIGLYGSSSDWDWDNVHAAVRETGGGPMYSSAGCQVVSGDYLEGQPRGAWSIFRSVLGLTNPISHVDRQQGSTSDDGRRFPYLLWTGLEAALVANTKVPAAEFTCIRYGSSGSMVEAVSEKLGLADPNVPVRLAAQRAISQWQLERSYTQTGALPLGQIKEVLGA